MAIGAASFVSIPPTGNPAGVGDTAIAPFPADGPTYAVLSTGDATQADQPDQAGRFPDADDGGEHADRAGRGDTARDVTVLAIPINVPAGANCLSFDFRFLSEEYPDFVNSQLQRRLHRRARRLDLDRVGLRRSPGSRTTSRSIPTGAPLTINSTGPSRMSAADGGGNAVRRRQRAAARQDRGDAGGAHGLSCRSSTQGDHALDSAVFADALRTSNESAATCVRGSQAIGPGLAITGPGPGFDVAQPLPDADGHGRQRAGRRPDRDRAHLQRGRHLRRAASRRSPRRAPALVVGDAAPRRSRPGPTPPRPRSAAPTAAPASARR